MKNKIFNHLLNIKLEAKPASTGQFVSRLQSFESVREFFTGSTMAAIVDLPFEIIFIIVVTKLVKQKGLINFLQILVTNKPTDIEIKVAIQGIKEIKKFEVDYISQMTDINTNIEKVS